MYYRIEFIDCRFKLLCYFYDSFPLFCNERGGTTTQDALIKGGKILRINDSYTI
jgi:hypothetical protein